MTGCVLFLLPTWVPAQESTQHICRADVRLGCVLAFEFCLSVCLPLIPGPLTIKFSCWLPSRKSFSSWRPWL